MFLKKLFKPKILKFLVGGGVAAIVNLLLIYFFIDRLGWNTPFLRNISNIVSMELSLLASFFIYRLWVWTGGNWTIRDVLSRQIPLYHVSAGAPIIVRALIIFPILDWFKVNPSINTSIGILFGATINYIISDRLVFNNSARQTSGIYYPEGLAPALEISRRPVAQTENRKDVRALSLVIPAYNEEGCIAQTVESIGEFLERENIVYEILVVNDNSRDRTEKILQQITDRNPKIRYINNYYPNGFGFAVRCGLENFTGDAVAIVMADSSDAPENIVDYYYKLQEGYDCVFGSRFIRGGKVIDYPAHKLFVNRLANLFIQVLFGLKFNDITNAFKIYRREVIEGVSPLLSHHFNLTVEIPLKSIIRGYSYVTVPITWQNRKTGVSKLKLKEMGSRYLFIVLSIWLEKHLSRGDYIRKHSHLNTLTTQNKS